MAAWGSALTAGHFCRSPKVTKTLCPDVRPSLMLGFLRSGIDPGGSAYGLLRCTSSRCVWLRQTVATLPPPDQSLHSACRRALRSKAGELTLGLLSGVEHSVLGFGFVVWLPLTPALSRGRGGRFVGFSKYAFDSVSQVDVSHPVHAISPLSLRERVRVRGF
jgi:hypothetical protein